MTPLDRPTVITAVREELDAHAQQCREEHAALGARVADRLGLLEPAPVPTPATEDLLDLGLWIDDAPKLVLTDAYLARLLGLPLSHFAVMVERSGGGLDLTWTTAQLAKLATATPEHERVLTLWPEPTAPYMTRLRQVLPGLLRALGRSPRTGHYVLEFDLEGHWKVGRVGGYASLTVAGATLMRIVNEVAAELGEEIEVEVTTFTDADRVFVRIARGELDDRPERLLASEDGGRSFTSVLELPQLTSFAIAGDGLTVWAGAAGGLWTARGGAMGFTQLSDVAVTCLHTRGPELFVCADPRSAPFALGRSTDGGATIEGLLRIEDVTQLAECPRCSTAGAECPAWVPDLLADYEIWLGAGDAGTATTGLPRDAGVPPECRPPPGCGCRAGARPIELGALCVTILLAAARRRRRSA